jgi:hypothetical protein
MTAFKFKEDKNFTAFGINFPAGEFVEVLQPSIIKKLENNSHFISKGIAPRQVIEDAAFEVIPNRGAKFKKAK